MNHQIEDIQIKNLDHLGIVAGIIDDIGIVEKINELLGIDSREKVNSGEVVKAIILNGLGFVSKPLYLFPKFFEDKAIEHLFGKGINAEDFNDDKLGRVMDKLYKYGLSELFLMIVLATIKKYKVSTKYSHLDSTSLHLHGEYNSSLNDENKELEIMKENPIIIKQGYSRDPSGSQSLMGETPKTALTHHRPDLKQCILDLIVSSDGDVPLYFRGGSGNESDKAVFGKLLVEYSKQINFESIMVADSALYSEKNLKLMGNIKWISRVPLSIKKAKNLVKALTSIEFKETAQKGYSYYEQHVTYGGVEQRWVIVESQERKNADLKKLSKEIEKESIKIQKTIAKLLKNEFSELSEVKSKISEIDSKLKYHEIADLEIIKRQSINSTFVYQVKCKLMKNQKVITERQRQAGRFILATNILDTKELNTSEVLKVYKEQQSCERGFRFICIPFIFCR